MIDAPTGCLAAVTTTWIGEDHSGIDPKRENSLRRLKRFCITAPAFHTAYPHEVKKGFIIPPVPESLRVVVLIQQGDLSPPQLSWRWAHSSWIAPGRHPTLEARSGVRASRQTVGTIVPNSR